MNSLEMSGGLLSRKLRHVQLDSVAGVQVAINPVMRLLGKARLSVIARERGAMSRRNIVFPAASTKVLQQTLEQFFPDSRNLLGVSRIRRRIFTVMLGLVLVVLVVLVCIFFPSNNIRWVVGLAIILCLAVAFSGLYTTMSIDEDTNMVLIRRGLIWTTLYSLPISAVELVTTTQDFIGKRLGYSSSIVLFFDGGRRRLQLLFISEKTARVVKSLSPDN